MQIAWLIAVIAGLAAGVLLVRFGVNGRSVQRNPSSPAGASRRFAPQRHRLADLAFFQRHSIPSLGFVLAMALIIGAGLVTILWLPARLVPAGEDLADSDRVRAVNDLRGTLLQAFVVLGAVIAAARTWRAVTERGQHTERLTATVEQLTHPHVQQRVAAIFTLEQLARDSSRDRTAIADILTGYVRTCSPWPPSRPGQYVEHAPTEQLLPLDRRAADVQAAISVLGRGPLVDRRRPLQLANVDLRVANLDGADLSRARLAGTNL
jgi:Pentapeptide repeats (8 copies)